MVTELRATALTLSMLDMAYERTMASLARAFEDTWSGLGERDGAQTLMKNIARGHRPYSGDQAATRISRILTYAVNQSLLIKKGRGQYEFFEPMFRDFINRF